MGSSDSSAGRSYLAAASIALVSGGLGILIGVWLRPKRDASRVERKEDQGATHQSSTSQQQPEPVPANNLVDFLLTVGQLKVCIL